MLIETTERRKSKERRAGNRVEERIRELYLRRASRFLRRAVNSLPREVVEHALIAANDGAAVLEIASRPETIEAAEDDDPLAEARVRGRAIAEKLLGLEGGCGTIATAMDALNISKQAVEKRRRKGNLIAIDTGKKGLLYPRWQFKISEYAVLDGLEEVLKILRAQGCIGWSVMSFFLNPHVDLDGESPLDALRQKRKEDVVVAASNYGEMGR